MKQNRHTLDQIIAKLRRADVELGKGRKVPEICKSAGRPSHRADRRAEEPPHSTISGKATDN